MWFLWFAIGYVAGMTVTLLFTLASMLAAWRATVRYRRELKYLKGVYHNARS